MGATANADLLQKARRNPGRLVLGPTTLSGSLSASSPFGGVALGLNAEAEIVWRTEYDPVRDPASGRIAHVGRRACDYPELYCLIEGPAWDEDVLAVTFARATKFGGSSPETRIEGTVIPSDVGAWPPVLFVSEDPKGKCVYFRRPLLLLSLRNAVAIANAKKCGLPMRFVPSPDSAWQTTPDWQICKRENLSL